ncbi:hypothetical protein THAOC_17342 [Thalassiosira oceanica]|uniref:Uncharacterized protein n=1 Tax=Thalassiosira oceanica TaxID=159749 RepID=K0SMA5_THAOC|nr:hypothetical protein THAOC_17342 [Thalassiosira oceanica]|eukprot:EJK62061.1 hypothetical protein THAOC_17342 [Thalassiosira oceanica]
MKLFTSLLAFASATNASLRGGPVVMTSNAVLSAVPAIPDPSLFMSGSIREGDDTCGTESEKVWKDADLDTASKGLKQSCAPTFMGDKTIKYDYPSCDATAAVIAACSSAGGMSYTVDKACSETSGSGRSIYYSKVPGCAGTSCTISDFDKQYVETATQDVLKEQSGGTWSCTATASFSNPSDEALLSVE